jgi:glutamine amidotransferase PdxT
VIDIETPSEIQDHVVDDFHKGDSTYPAVFIRAPAILKVIMIAFIA